MDAQGQGAGCILLQHRNSVALLSLYVGPFDATPGRHRHPSDAGRLDNSESMAWQF